MKTLKEFNVEYSNLENRVHQMEMISERMFIDLLKLEEQYEQHIKELHKEEDGNKN